MPESTPPKSIADSDRWDTYDKLLRQTHGDMFARPVILVNRHTGAVLASYASLADAFERLPTVPLGVKADASLGWAPT